jgi:hypothetical protein
MQARTWGRLVAAQLGAPLLVSCSSAPAVAPTAPAGPAVAASSSAAGVPAAPEVDPTAGPPGLGAWAPLAAGAAPVVHAPRVWRVAPTDRGVIGLARSRLEGVGCAWNGAPDGGCTGFFFAPWKEGKGSPARHPVGAVGPWGPAKVSRNWSWIWPGKEGAYALDGA